MAAASEDKRAPLLEEEKGNITEQFVTFDAFQVDASTVAGSDFGVDISKMVFSTLSTYWRIAAKTTAKACGVAIGWSWAAAIQTAFSEELVPQSLNTSAGLIYAVAMSFLTAWMVMWISKHQNDPNDVEFGRYGRNSRELLLVVQPMVLAWAWKDSLRGAVWEHLPDDTPEMLVMYRFGFAFAATLLIACGVNQLGNMIKRASEGQNPDESMTYPVVLMSMLSASFGLFLAWCWNESAASLSQVLSDGRTSEGVALTIYAALLTGAATCGTMYLGNLAGRLRSELAECKGSEADMPLFESGLPLWCKFVDLISASLGYMVGWAWSDAATQLLLHALSMTDMKVFYLIYALTVSGVAILYTSHVAKVLDNPDTPAGVKQYATLILNALGFMVGWAWKAYIQYFVELMPVGGGLIVMQFGQAIMASIIASLVYHKLRMLEAESQASDVEKYIHAVTNTAGNAMD